MLRDNASIWTFRISYDYIVNPFIINSLNKLDIKVINILFILLISIFLLDIIVSSIVLNDVKNDIKKVDKDNTEEITKKIKSVLSKNVWTRRLFSAFPNAKYIKDVIKNNISKVITKEQKEEEKIKIDAESKIKKIKLEYDYKISKVKESTDKKIKKLRKKYK